MRDAFRVGASVASIWALALTVADTPTQAKDIFLFFCRYPTLCVWGKHSAWTSTAEIGGVAIAHYIGQKPGGIAAPTYLFFAKRKGKPKETKTNKQYLFRKR